jgi:capsular polysaccharide export protein
VDELVAAALLAYPRYLDPATGLPCPPEVVVARLIDGDVPETNLLVAARRLQGKVLRSVRSLLQ